MNEEVNINRDDNKMINYEPHKPIDIKVNNNKYSNLQKLKTHRKIILKPPIPHFNGINDEYSIKVVAVDDCIDPNDMNSLCNSNSCKSDNSNLDIDENQNDIDNCELNHINNNNIDINTNVRESRILHVIKNDTTILRELGMLPPIISPTTNEQSPIIPNHNNYELLAKAIRRNEYANKLSLKVRRNKDNNSLNIKKIKKKKNINKFKVNKIDLLTRLDRRYDEKTGLFSTFEEFANRESRLEYYYISKKLREEQLLEQNELISFKEQEYNNNKIIQQLLKENENQSKNRVREEFLAYRSAKHQISVNELNKDNINTREKNDYISNATKNGVNIPVLIPSTSNTISPHTKSTTTSINIKFLSGRNVIGPPTIITNIPNDEKKFNQRIKNLPPYLKQIVRYRYHKNKSLYRKSIRLSNKSNDNDNDNDEDRYSDDFDEEDGHSNDNIISKDYYDSSLINYNSIQRLTPDSVQFKGLGETMPLVVEETLSPHSKAIYYNKLYENHDNDFNFPVIDWCESIDMIVDNNDVDSLHVDQISSGNSSANDEITNYTNESKDDEASSLSSYAYLNVNDSVANEPVHNKSTHPIIESVDSDVILDIIYSIVENISNQLPSELDTLNHRDDSSKAVNMPITQNIVSNNLKNSTDNLHEVNIASNINDTNNNIDIHIVSNNLKNSIDNLHEDNIVSNINDTNNNIDIRQSEMSSNSMTTYTSATSTVKRPGRTYRVVSYAFNSIRKFISG